MTTLGDMGVSAHSGFLGGFPFQEKCHQYWPAERSARYQYFVVDPMAEYNMPQYILREFKVTDARVSRRRSQLKHHCAMLSIV